jgi:hypothetical protein
MEFWILQIEIIAVFGFAFYGIDRILVLLRGDSNVKK